MKLNIWLQPIRTTAIIRIDRTPIRRDVNGIRSFRLNLSQTVRLIPSNLKTGFPLLAPSYAFGCRFPPLEHARPLFYHTR